MIGNCSRVPRISVEVCGGTERPTVLRNQCRPLERFAIAPHSELAAASPRRVVVRRPVESFVSGRLEVEDVAHLVQAGNSAVIAKGVLLAMHRLCGDQEASQARQRFPAACAVPPAAF